MNKLSFLGVLTGGATLLSSCVQPRQVEPPLVVNVRGEGDGCRVTVQGERVTSDRLLELGRSAARRRAIAVYAKNTPYKCIGAAIYTLQRAGLASLDAAMWDDR